MLGKLIKYEFKNTSKVMLAIYGLVCGVTLLGAIAFGLMSPDITTDFSELLTASILILYILSIFALFIVTYVYVCVHFYKTMYSHQGYLTHTLPVSTISIFHVKLLVSFCWMMGSLILLLLSIFVLLAGASHGEIFQTLNGEFWADFFAELNSLGISGGSFFGFFIFCIIISCFSYLLLTYASMSIGQLFNHNKIGFSIVAGIAIYFVEQIISTVVSSICMIANSEILFEDTASVSGVMFEAFWSDITWSASLLTLAFVFILYGICIFILKKHINLD